ncbi:hypothetical protein K1719_038471 [Acacia pycnantha]|nr:hypothetical protein K1719_038471 [Acacia pycnantha]
MGEKRKERSPETAYNVGGESSSTFNTLNSSPECKYDVFLSFAGKDTRLNFTGHLYEAFSRSGIICFRDDEALQKGEDINYLFRAIEDSLCAVLVISESYAKSKWCLDELQIILESQNTLGRRVFPIFYNVDPADVRGQRGSFGEALAELEKKFKENPTKVQGWRTALSKIGNLSGWVTRNMYEAGLIKTIVGDIWRFLSTKLPTSNDNLVGIDSKVAEVIPFLEIGSDDKRFVGIWGMGGVGKTTLARVVFEKLSHKFEIYCFFEKVKDALLLPEGLVTLQNRLLARLEVKGLKVSDSYEGMQMIRRRLCEKKVLLVLDDIEKMEQIKDLAGNLDWFGKGSRIIITTRDSYSLTSIGVERIYEVKTRNDDESLQIFSKIAFKNNRPEEKYLEYSKSVVKYSGGLPLALEALGYYLVGRRVEAMWVETLNKLKIINPHKDILKVLKISYDGLDDKEQTIFLDIVSFFKHWKKKEVTQILKACDLDPILGIEALIEKTLLVETEYGELQMHELYEDLGWHIIQQKSPKSRLCKFGEIKEAVKNNKGFEGIEAIVLEDKSSNNYFRRDGDIIEVHPEAFSEMSRLRLLLLSCATKVPAGLKKLSCALKFVRWPLFPLEALPLPLDELVHIEMDHSSMKQLWNGIKAMNHLKFIDLRESANFTETPDFSNVQSLEHLRLSRCASLVKVHESLGVLKKLVEVDLYGCKNLNSLPSKLETNSLRKLDLNGCEKVEKLPDFGDGMVELSYLDASRTAITNLPESLGSLTGLRYLSLCETGLIELSTECFSGLVGLVFLSLQGCECLVSLPRLPPHLIRLEADGCSSMKHSLDDQIIILVTSLDHERRGQTKYVISEDEEENMLFPYDEDFEDNDFLLYELNKIKPEYDSFRKFFAVMPSGGKIPSWFEPNIEYYDEESGWCEIEVEVPPNSNFRGSKWSGIVVCLHLKRCEGRIRWSFKAPEGHRYSGQAGASHGILDIYGQEDGLCVMVLEFNQENCWQHLRDGNNFLHILVAPDDDDNCMDILGYGWRVICKEDIQKWCHLNHFDHFTQPQHAAAPSKVELPFTLLRIALGGWPKEL